MSQRFLSKCECACAANDCACALSQRFLSKCECMYAENDCACALSHRFLSKCECARAASQRFLSKCECAEYQCCECAEHQRNLLSGNLLERDLPRECGCAKRATLRPQSCFFLS